MISYFENSEFIYLVSSSKQLDDREVEVLGWLLESSHLSDASECRGSFVGPRKEIVSPWSTNATEIAGNAGLETIRRIERYKKVSQGFQLDPMLEDHYELLDAEMFSVSKPEVLYRSVEDINEYNKTEGLALSEEEVQHLENVSKKLGRKLTDCEVYAFAQINSEHCRHKIFNGEFVIGGESKKESLFSLIKKTSKNAPENIVSAYKDNVAFFQKTQAQQFFPSTDDSSNSYESRKIDATLSLKAETHNFPTAVEPFYGASTGSGGEIRDRLAGGIGSLPLAGTAVYMTANPRLGLSKEAVANDRKWKYQSPKDILVKASNGASDFGNKFGQPLISGSLFTYEAETKAGFFSFDRCIMLAGGIGYANIEHALKKESKPGDLVVVLGGDNYRIGMAGGSVSSVNTGELSKDLELSAIQRANPEMQKRVANVIRAMCESNSNPILLIHDHGSGGHVNCLSELLEDTGGVVELSKLPVGDITLNFKELKCNESQERMGLIVAKEDFSRLEKIAKREQAPIYVVGAVTDDHKIQFKADNGETPFSLATEELFGSAPKTVLNDEVKFPKLDDFQHGINSKDELVSKIKDVLTLESVACKDWLTNKVDRSVTGLVAQQQCVGELQLPLSNVGVMALDYLGENGIATSIGHNPIAGLIDAKAGATLSIAESLTNIVWAPLADGLNSVVLSANWMWPAKNPSENTRLYEAVEGCSEFAVSLGIPIPTGKDSLSMTMKYGDGDSVKSPGTVVISAAGECSDVKNIVTPDLKKCKPDSSLVYIDISGDSSDMLGATALSQVLSQIGSKVPTVKPEIFKAGFSAIQNLIKSDLVLAGHDVSTGGVITTILEMCFAGNLGVELTSDSFQADNLVEFLFSEKPAVVIQVSKNNLEAVEKELESAQGVNFEILGNVVTEKGVNLKGSKFGDITLDIEGFRSVWFEPSYKFELEQSCKEQAEQRKLTLSSRSLEYNINSIARGADNSNYRIDKVNSVTKAKPSVAVIREKGSNGEREMAMALYCAGFNVVDVTMTDIASGAISLKDFRFIVFPGGFSNSDVLGAGRGWASKFLFDDNIKDSLTEFYSREDTLSLGVCNGCQLMVELGVIKGNTPESSLKMSHNISGKFESTFLNVDVLPSSSVLLKDLVGSRLGIWVAHGEGRFSFSNDESNYSIPLKYISSDFPINPNGSQFNAAGVCSEDGRHLCMMPHLERSVYYWQWPYTSDIDVKKHDYVSPWALAFKSARDWLTS